MKSRYLLIVLFLLSPCFAFAQNAESNAKVSYLIKQIPEIQASLEEQKLEQTKTLEELGAIYMGLRSREVLQFFEDYNTIFERVEIWAPTVEDIKIDTYCKDRHSRRSFKGMLYVPVLAIKYKMKISVDEFEHKYFDSGDEKFVKGWDKLSNFTRCGTHNCSEDERSRAHVVFIYDLAPSIYVKKPKEDYKGYDEPVGIIGSEGYQTLTWQWPITEVKEMGFEFIEPSKKKESAENEKTGTKNVEIKDVAITDAAVSEETTISVETDVFMLSVYDFGAVDGDVIDYYLNGKLIQEGVKLSKTPYSVIINNKETPNAEIMFLATSAGKAGPCTILAKIEGNGKTFRMSAKKGQFMKIKLK
jgi:hypothetical protein